MKARLWMSASPSGAGSRTGGRRQLLASAAVTFGTASLAVLAPVLGPGTKQLVAQSPDAGADPASVITAAEIARHVEGLAGDSMRGRVTPSPALDRTAQHLVTQFRQLGLVPGVWNSNRQDWEWLEHYPLPGQLRLDEPGSAVFFGLIPDSSKPYDLTDTASVSFANAAYFSVPRIAQVPMLIDGQSKGTVLVAGHHTAASLQQLELHERIALYVPPEDLGPAARQQVIDQLYARSLGVVVLGPDDTSAFARAHAGARAHPPRIVEVYQQTALRPHGWVVYVWPGALRSVDAAAGLELVRLRMAGPPLARSVRQLQVVFKPEVQPLSPAALTAPNVVGRLEGSDSALRRELVVFLAHMDQPASGAREADDRGSAPDTSRQVARPNDNTIGVAGLLALARAFSQPGARPRRSLLFVATSGAVPQEFWGAGFNVRNRPDPRQIAGVINLDGLAGTAGDSVQVAGLREVDGMTTIEWIMAAHPELRLTVVDGGTAYVPASDHFAFSRLGKPLLYFHGDSQALRATQNAPAAPADADYGARVTRLAFYMGSDIANASRPRLNAAGRRRFLEALDRWVYD